MLLAWLSNNRWRGYCALIVIGLVQTSCFIALLSLAKDELATADLQVEPYLFVLLILAISGLAAGRYLERYIAEAIAQNYIQYLRNRVYEHTLALPLSSINLVNSGGALLRLTGDMTAIRNWLVYGVAPLIVLSVVLLGALSTLFYLHWMLIIICLISLSFAVLGNYFLGKSLYQATKQVRSERSRMIKAVNERLGLIKLIRLFNQAGKESRLFRKSVRRLKRKQMNKAHRSALIRGFNEAVLLFSVLMIVGAAVYLNRIGVLSSDFIPVLLMASLYLVSQLRRLSRLYELWTLRNVSEDKIEELLARRTIKKSRNRRLSGDKGCIEVSGVGLDRRFAHVSFAIAERDRLALEGKSGSGKSSLLSALAGLEAISAGAIYFNQQNARKVSPARWAQLVTLVSPELPLLKGGLSENLFYGARKKSEQFTHEVVRVTGLEDYLQLESAEELQVELRGDNLSSTLKFRVMLARALLRRPQLLLIDSDVALRNEEIREMLAKVFEFYTGAVVIAETYPEYESQITGRVSLNMSESESASKIVSLSGEAFHG